MKAKITKKDGTVIEIEGTADEIQRALDEEKKTPKDRKKNILLDDVRRIVAEELAKQPRYCHHYHPWWGVLNPLPLQQPLYPQPTQPQITWTIGTGKDDGVIPVNYPNDPMIELGQKLPKTTDVIPSVFLTGMTVKQPGALVPGGAQVCGGNQISLGGEVWTGTINPGQHLGSLYDLSRKIQS